MTSPTALHPLVDPPAGLLAAALAVLAWLNDRHTRPHTPSKAADTQLDNTRERWSAKTNHPRRTTHRVSCTERLSAGLDIQHIRGAGSVTSRRAPGIARTSGTSEG